MIQDQLASPVQMPGQMLKTGTESRKRSRTGTGWSAGWTGTGRSGATQPVDCSTTTRGTAVPGAPTFCKSLENGKGGYIDGHCI